MSRSGIRQNEYFIPRDGIDREVISADICRYLGNDALVRPGHYQNPETGQPVQGYYVTAYRNLTSAMIEDLKVASARWDNERRQQTARNSSGVQYRSSETHQSRQHHGPPDAPYREDTYARDPPYDAMRYPGSGAPGYTGVAGGSYSESQQGYGGPLPPSGGGGGYGGGGPGGYPQPQHSPGLQDVRYVSAHAGPPMMSHGYQSQDQPRPGPPVPGPPHPVYASGAPPPPTSQAGYPSPAYSYPNAPPSSGPPPYNNMQQPQDPFLGRGQASQPPPQMYPTQGYEGTPPPNRTSITPADNQTPLGDSSNRLGDRRR